MPFRFVSAHSEEILRYAQNDAWRTNFCRVEWSNPRQSHQHRNDFRRRSELDSGNLDCQAYQPNGWVGPVGWIGSRTSDMSRSDEGNAFIAGESYSSGAFEETSNDAIFLRSNRGAGNRRPACKGAECGPVGPRRFGRTAVGAIQSRTGTGATPPLVLGGSPFKDDRLPRMVRTLGLPTRNRCEHRVRRRSAPNSLPY